MPPSTLHQPFITPSAPPVAPCRLCGAPALQAEETNGPDPLDLAFHLRHVRSHPGRLCPACPASFLRLAPAKPYCPRCLQLRPSLLTDLYAILGGGILADCRGLVHAWAAGVLPAPPLASRPSAPAPEASYECA